RAETGFGEAIGLQEQALALDPGSAHRRNELALSLDELSWALLLRGLKPEAEVACRRTLGMRQRLCDERPTDPDAARYLARSHDRLAGVLVAQGKLDDANAEFAEAARLHTSAVVALPTSTNHRVELIDTLLEWGPLLRDVGRLADAEGVLRQAVEHAARLAGDHPADAGFTRWLLRARFLLSGTLSRPCRHSEAAAVR